MFHRQHNFIFNLIFIIIFWNNCFFPEILKKKNVLLGIQFTTTAGSATLFFMYFFIFLYFWHLFSCIFKNSQDSKFLSELFFPSSKHWFYFWNSGYVQGYNMCPLFLLAPISSIIAKNQVNIFIKKSKIWNISQEIHNRLWPY